MSVARFYSLGSIQRSLTLGFELNFHRRNYAKASTSVSMLGMKKKKVGGKVGPMIEKKILPVETDPEKLVNYCCGSNIYKTGEDVKLAPDNEYPDWLWTIRTGEPVPLEELDPNSKDYWRRLRRMAIKKQNQLKKLNKF
ncbi:unnamed protein product [Ceutorhynchus assimilis]|uniref:Large ribosomal subunit protein mL54 n=1 Tax=Ceutorhynchus assimilis TaxID=467358 RepID=A0A9N9MKQ7_9CUCU|nr:unnamed protein product [Ceutorhynchus assimilis]